MLKLKHHIDFQKGMVPVVVLAAMYAADAWQSPTAWAYLAMHGTYGPLWVMKSHFFPDKSWEERVPWIPALIFVHGVLAVFLAPAMMYILGHQEAPIQAIGVSLIVYILGVFFHFASDMQKHTQLKAQPGLITDGLFSLSRNVNYFGELLIYGAFMALGAAVLRSAWPLLWLLAFVPVMWVPRMRQKDQRLARHEGFKAYGARTKLFIPFVW